VSEKEAHTEESTTGKQRGEGTIYGKEALMLVLKVSTSQLSSFVHH
jgi:hypothetical protein